MNKKHVKVAAASILLLFLLVAAVAFLSRGNLLRHVAGKHMARLEQRYGLTLAPVHQAG